MNRRKRYRLVSLACWGLVTASTAWTAATHGWWAAAEQTGLLIALMAVLLVAIVWIERGKP